MLKYKYIFQLKYTKAILANNTRKRLWLEISKMLIAVLEIQIYCVICYNSRHTFLLRTNSTPIIFITVAQTTHRLQPEINIQQVTCNA